MELKEKINGTYVCLFFNELAREFWKCGIRKCILGNEQDDGKKGGVGSWHCFRQEINAFLRR